MEVPRADVLQKEEKHKRKREWENYNPTSYHEKISQKINLDFVRQREIGSSTFNFVSPRSTQTDHFVIVKK